MKSIPFEELNKYTYLEMLGMITKLQFWKILQIESANFGTILETIA